ncbi:MAG: hypothetical protein WC123_04990 [Bacilli bacterium]|jgi:hypothetical protein
MEDIKVLKLRKSRYESIRRDLEYCEVNNRPCYGFCKITCSNRSANLEYPPFTKNSYPELYKQKPKSNYKFSLSGSSYRHYRFWWSPDNNKRRIQAVNAAIKLVDEKIATL